MRLANPQHRYGFESDWATESTGPFADIYLMYEKGTDPKIASGVQDLASILRADPNSRFSKTIRRIAFFECAQASLASMDLVFVT